MSLFFLQIYKANKEYIVQSCTLKYKSCRFITHFPSINTCFPLFQAALVNLSINLLF